MSKSLLIEMNDVKKFMLRNNVISYFVPFSLPHFIGIIKGLDDYGGLNGNTS